MMVDPVPVALSIISLKLAKIHLGRKERRGRNGALIRKNKKVL